MQALEPSVRKGKRHYEKSEKAVKRGKRSSYDSVPFRWIHRVHAVPIDSPAGCSWKLASWSASSRGVQRAEDAHGDLKAHPGAGGPPTRREAHRAATNQGRRRHTRIKTERAHEQRLRRVFRLLQDRAAPHTNHAAPQHGHVKCETRVQKTRRENISATWGLQTS